MIIAACGGSTTPLSPGIDSRAFAQQAYIEASNPDGGDFFGTSVALNGGTLAVGARGEDSNATGINGDQANDDALASGAVYIFARNSGGAWIQQAYVKASNTEPSSRNQGDGFGISVALDGDKLAVGASGEHSSASGVNGDQYDNSKPFSGAVYVFTRDTDGAWSQQAYVKASNTDGSDGFGGSIALDNETLAVGASREASFVQSDQSDNSAFESGAVYVFTSDSTSAWTQQAFIKAPNTDVFSPNCNSEDGICTGGADRFGISVALDGDTLAVGADGDDSSATGIDGDQSVRNAYDSGAVYVFTRDTGGVWTRQAIIKASNTDEGDFFGTSVALDGDTLAVGARGEDSSATGVNGNQNSNSVPFAGAVYVFTRDTGGVWTQQAYIKASNTGWMDFFGESIALHGDSLVVGARFERSNATGVNGDSTDNCLPFAGATYVFTRNTEGAWSQQAYIKPSNTGEGFRFGTSVASDGDTFAVGAVGARGNATGVDGNQGDNSGPAAGAVYVFE